jgi:hypothetical protein
MTSLGGDDVFGGMVFFHVSHVIGPDVPKTIPKESRLHLILSMQINELCENVLRASNWGERSEPQQEALFEYPIVGICYAHPHLLASPHHSPFARKAPPFKGRVWGDGVKEEPFSHVTRA